MTELPTDLPSAIDFIEQLDQRLTNHERLLPMFLAAAQRQEDMLLQISAAVGVKRPTKPWAAIVRVLAAGAVCAAIVGLGYTARAGLREAAAEAAEHAVDRAVARMAAERGVR